MNIFYLHSDARSCAQMHCDKHVVKMILETTQLLCTAHRVCDGNKYCDENHLYKKTHFNHPSAVWVRKSKDNYRWLHELLFFLLTEYQLRYKKIHKCSNLYHVLRKVPTNINNDSFTEPPQCMPDTHKHVDTVIAYRNYYNADKATFAKWGYSKTPTWFKGEM